MCVLSACFLLQLLSESLHVYMLSQFRYVAAVVAAAAAVGEHWDDTITMDTYYNPVPHFGFKHALSHSPQLRSVPLQPKPVNEKDPFGPGLDDL